MQRGASGEAGPTALQRHTVPLAMLLVLAAVCFAGWLFKAHCLSGGWTGAEQYTTGCYSDAVPFWSGRGVAAGDLPYFQARIEYPVLTGGLIWIEGALVHLLFGAHAGTAPFLAMVTLVNGLLAALVLLLLHRAGLRGVRLWAWAASPLLVLYVGHNWDLLAIALAMGAVVLASEDRLVPAAALAGLGVAAKLFPILLLALLGLQALFGTSGTGWRWRLARAVAVSAAAIGAWAAVNLPVALAAFENWSEFYRFSGERRGTYASTWYVLASLHWLETDLAQRNLVSAASFLAGAIAILAVGWRTHAARPWLLFAPLLAWFLLTSKVYSPQFDLWLYPVLLLTAPRLAPVALFVIAGIAAYFAEFWFFAGLASAWPFADRMDIALAAGLRAGAMLWLVVDTLRLPPPAWLTATLADQGRGSALARR